MRILHTSDWHAGKSLFRQDRTEDLAFALTQMLEVIEQERVDAVLVAGDLYDSFHPPAHASESLYRFFLELHRRRVPALLISGNHDSSRFWYALKNLLELAAIHVFDIPQPDSRWQHEIRGELLTVTALPYPFERQLVKLAHVFGDTVEQRLTYAEKVSGLLRTLTKDLPREGYHVLCAHLMMDGAQPSQSERQISLSEAFTIPPQALPGSFDYVALGHIHKHQPIQGSQSPAWYSGTPYQIDFGEAERAKGVLLVDLEENKAPVPRFVELKLKRQLKNIKCHEDELDTICQEYQDFAGLLKLQVQVEGARKGLRDQLRSKLGPSLLSVELLANQLPQVLPQHRALKLESPLEVYEAYYNSLDRPFSPELRETFTRLWEQAKI